MTRKFLLALMMIAVCASCSQADYTSTGSGEADDPYIISTIDDLEVLAENPSANKYYKLSNDIQLAGYSNFPGIGSTTTEAFTGHFDGNGHTIYVNIAPLPPENNGGTMTYIPITYNRALFGYVNTTSDYAIKNLKVEGSVRGYNAGGIISILEAGEITGCSFSGDITVNTRNGESVIDDLIYELDRDDVQDVDAVEVLDDVEGTATSYGKINAGGIAAFSKGEITNCSFRGTITASAHATTASAGGIAGRMYDGNITDCCTAGDSIITASTATTADNSIALGGGIAGNAVTPLDSEIASCIFDGSVSSTYYAGGIGGLVRGTILTGNTVTDKAVISGTYSAGGIAGYMASGAQALSNVTESGSTVTAESYSAGGIIGLLETNKGAVYSNTSYAAIRGDASYLGGIVGALGYNTNASTAVGSNTYSGADYGIGRDEWDEAVDGATTKDTSTTYTVITTGVPTTATVGTAYSGTLDTSAPSSMTVTWSYDSSLPSWLTGDTSGNLSGTPTTAGSYSFTAIATITNYTEISAAITITVSSSSSSDSSTTINLAITTTSLTSATQHVPYSADLYASGYSTYSSIAWSLASGSTLPAGLSITTDGANGLIYGTPTSSGTSSFTVLVTLTSGDNTYTDTQTLTLTVNSAPGLTISTDTLPDAFLNKQYSADIEATASANWSITSGTLPDGLRFSTISGKGRIYGTPSETGTFSITVRAVAGAVSADKTFSLLVNPANFSITTGQTLPPGTEGKTYLQALSTDAKITSRDSRIWYVDSGDFPPGLTLSRDNGVISGTPTAEGSYNFRVRLLVGDQITAKTFNLFVIPGLTIASSDAPPSGKEDTEYTYTFTANLFGAAWTVFAGTLPAGLTLAANGRLSGIPSKAGEYIFTVQAESGGLKAYRQCTITIDPALSILTDPALPRAKVSTWYSVTLSADTDYSARWTLLNGTLPAGLTLNPATGTISGIPTEEVTSTFTIQAEVGSYLAARTFMLTVGGLLEILESADLTGWKEGEYNTITFTTDSAYPVSWSLTGGNLPAGLTFTNGTLSGTPTTAGTYTFTITAEAGGLTASKTFTLEVAAALTIYPEYAMLQAKLGAYSEYYFYVDEYVGGYALWSVSSGTLPAGMNLDGADGKIYGSPTTEGTYTFTVQVTTGNYSATKEYVLNVRPSLSITTRSLPHANTNELYTFTLQTDAGEDEAVVWMIYDGLPEGLTFDVQTGTLSGYITKEGRYSFTVYAATQGFSAYKYFELVAGPAMNITTPLVVPVLNAGEHFTLALQTDITSTADSSWSVLKGILPPGLELDSKTGIISGTPTTAGTYSFTVRNVTGYSVAEQTFTLTVGFAITDDTTLPSGKAGQHYTHKFTAGGVSTGNLLWSASRDILPTGLTLNSQGVLSGTTNEAGTYTFTVYAFVSNDVSAHKTFTLTIDTSSAVPILNSSLPDGQVEEEYYAELSSSLDGVTWQVLSGNFPKGLTLNENGIISGTPTESGTFTFIVLAQTTTRDGTKQFTITIAPKPEPVSNDVSASSGGGGCDSGFGVMSIMLVGVVFRKR